MKSLFFVIALVYSPLFVLPNLFVQQQFLTPSSHIAPATNQTQQGLRQYIIRQWKREHGMAENSILCICQTEDGYLWMGTEESGLIRFDGHRFRTFTPQNSPLPDAAIRSLTEDRLGTLWIGTASGVATFKNGKWRVFSRADSMPENRTFTLLADRKDGVWIGSLEGVFYRSSHGTVHYSKDNGSGLRSNNIRALAFDSAGVLHIGTFGGGIYRLDLGNGHCIEEKTEAGYSTIKNVLALCTQPDGAMWAASQEGLYYKGHSADSVWRMVYSSEWLGAINVKRLVVERTSGALWIGTMGGGLYRLEGKPIYGKPEQGKPGQGKSAEGCRLQRFSTEEGLVNNGIEALVFDHEGSLWVGTDGGLNQLREGSVKPLLVGGKPFTEITNSVLLDAEQRLWVGTLQGLYMLRDSGFFGQEHRDFTLFTKEHGLKSLMITALFQDRFGRLWVGTNTGGLHLREGRRFRSFTPAEGFAGNVVRIVVEDSTGNIWAGTDAGVSKLTLERGVWRVQSFTPQTGLRRGVCASLAYHARTKTIWVGQIVGEKNVIQILDTNGNFVKEIPLPVAGTSVAAITTNSSDGQLWISTNKGLGIYNDEKFSWFTTNEGLPTNVIGAILHDEKNVQWIATGQGIMRVSITSFARNVAKNGTATIPRIDNDSSYRLFINADGMLDPSCAKDEGSSVFAAPNGRLFFATDRGVSMLRSNAILHNNQQPNVWVEAVRADGRCVLDNTDSTRFDALLLPYTTNALEIDYTALSLEVPEAVRFEYLLEGYDKHWTQAGARRTAYYTNLPFGASYRFRVRACNNHGVWSETREPLVFAVKAPWWASWWAYCLYATLGAVLVRISLQRRDHSQRKKILEEQREREAEIVRRKNAELAEANTELADANEELQLLNAEKNELFGIVAHDLKNPLGAIMLSAELVQMRSAGNINVLEYADNILRSSERMMELIKNLLDVNAIERGGMSFSPVHVDIGMVLVGIVEHYYASAAIKNIRIHYDFKPNMIAYADELASIQIMDNLISNAVKYSPHDKNVWVRISHSFLGIGHGAGDNGASHSSLAIGHLSNDNSSRPMTNDQVTNDYLRIEVADEGPGISAEDMKKLFGKFARLSARPTGGEHSTGLGLSIAKKMVEAMNGRVWCESELGKGATFIVELPSTA
ncbi:MAG: ATP-binding protein [Candidatus Kapabacteria bacterium]|jgi:signal transduction histidine kinase/ligand-binding sensor domain-containing protein|nr:ATP-binding protein [Candidatus Kapabacteria bacterium]